MLIDGEFAVSAAPEVLMQHLFDARFMASCLPGCEHLELLDADRYRAVILIAMAGIEARFDMQVHITQRDAHAIRATIRGEEGGRASTLQADSRITLAAAALGTLVSYRADVSVTGRLGRFALGMMKKKAQALGAEFATNLQQKLQTLGAPICEASAAPADATGPNAAAPNVAVGRQPTWWQAVLLWWRGIRGATHKVEG